MALAPVSLSQLHSPGGYFDVSSRVAAMAGSYLLMVMVLLMSRFPPLERALGQPRLVYLHRRLAAWPIVLIIIHVVFVTLGYAATSHHGFLSQIALFLRSYNNMFEALVGLGVLLFATFVSVPVVRRLFDYESWWAIHLSLYGALVLSFPHQISTGVMFLSHPLSKYLWTSMWIASLVVLVYSRVVTTALLNLRLRLKVQSVTQISPTIYAITLTGSNLSRLRVSGGQFFQWRFAVPGLMLHPHPYSLSALPKPPYLRLTVKDSGEHSGALARLSPGTRVFIEGPYGALTHHHRQTDSVTLIAAGVGVTPLRAMLDDLPSKVDLTMVVRAPSSAEIPHLAELKSHLDSRGAVFSPILGSRHNAPMTPETLLRAAPNIARGDVFLCGPPSFTEQVVSSLHALGVPDSNIHHEMFTF